jgi:hypothetical protein
MRSVLKPTFFIFITVAGILTTGCNSAQAPSPDAASGNLAPVDQSQPAQPAPSNPSSSQTSSNQSSSGQASAPAPNSAYSASQPAEYDSGTVLVDAQEPPPPLPDYSQPPSPGDNYIWTPGYWNYTESGYYWVPGAWLIAP